MVTTTPKKPKKTDTEKAAQLDKLIRRIRNNDRLWDEDDIYHNRLKKLKDARMKLREQMPDTTPRGPYSGMTRAELAATGTCEPDWF